MNTPKVRILSSKESAAVRNAYVTAFVDTSSEYFQRNIAVRQEFSDGLHSTGYFWDCIRNYTRITFQEFRNELLQTRDVYALADDHSRNRVVGAPLWPYPPGSVASLSSELLLQLLPALPEDLYVFDTSMSWTLILTHEYEGDEDILIKVTRPA